MTRVNKGKLNFVQFERSLERFQSNRNRTLAGLGYTRRVVNLPISITDIIMSLKILEGFIRVIADIR